MHTQQMKARSSLTLLTKSTGGMNSNFLVCSPIFFQRSRRCEPAAVSYGEAKQAQPSHTRYTDQKARPATAAQTGRGWNATNERRTATERCDDECDEARGRAALGDFGMGVGKQESGSHCACILSWSPKVSSLPTYLLVGSGLVERESRPPRLLEAPSQI